LISFYDLTRELTLEYFTLRLYNWRVE
jgi:hypothetical protein